jgi:hypothetical protein
VNDRKAQDRPTLAETYSNVTAHGDLSLPAQAVLAASAWTGPKEGASVGATLMRLRDEWQSKKPSPHGGAVPVAQGPRKVRRMLRKLVLANVVRSVHALHAMRLLKDWPAAHEALAVHGACCGLADPLDAADKGLRYWLENPRQAPSDPEQRLMWAYIADCLADEAKRLRQGMRGRTNHHPDGGS